MRWVPVRAARTRWIHWLPAAALMATIWLLSSWRLSGVPMGLVPFRDKGAHALVYAALGFWVAHGVLLSVTCPGLRRGRLWVLGGVACAMTVSWGLLDEIHQSFVPGRDASGMDLVADAIGAVVGTLGRVGWRLVFGRGVARTSTLGNRQATR